MACRPPAPGWHAQSRQAAPPARCSGSAKGGASRPCDPVQCANCGSAPVLRQAGQFWTGRTHVTQHSSHFLHGHIEHLRESLNGRRPIGQQGSRGKQGFPDRLAAAHRLAQRFREGDEDRGRAAQRCGDEQGVALRRPRKGCLAHKGGSDVAHTQRQVVYPAEAKRRQPLERLCVNSYISGLAKAASPRKQHRFTVPR
jgi:hypothetical protein